MKEKWYIGRDGIVTKEKGGWVNMDQKINLNYFYMKPKGTIAEKENDGKGFWHVIRVTSCVMQKRTGLKKEENRRHVREMSREIRTMGQADKKKGSW